KRKVAVSEMCDVFNVSGATIRADLRQLEEEGLLDPNPRRRSYSVFSGKNAKLLFLRCVTSLMYRAPPFVPISASWKRRGC
ncbi:hypothetical protein C5706_26485, partial [Klebsiella pneumoniae]